MASPPTDHGTLRPTIFQPVIGADETLAWPALPAPQAGEKLALLHQLAQSQWWTPEELLGQQLRQAAVLLTHCTLQVPFYRDRLAQAGFVANAPITPELWSRLPILTRAELQQAGEALHAVKLPRGHGKLHELTTSGSTGRPITARGSEIAQLFWDVLTLREHLWHGRDFTTKLAAIRSLPSGLADYPKGATSTYWNSTVAQVFGHGPAVGLHIAAKVEEQVAWLQCERPDYLLTYPSALRALLLHCRDRQVRFPQLRQVRTVSEPMTEDLQELCRDIWGVDVTDAYSSQETGYLAFQCPEEGSYHVQSETVLLEVLDESGKACAPGEVGEVVVTPLHNFAMPLLRYAIGDLAEVGPPCACGRGLPVLKRILGRTRDMLIYPDGRKTWALLGSTQFARIPEIRQFQIVQHSVDDIEIRLVADRRLKPEEETQVGRAMQKRCGHDFPVRITYHEEIPRSAGGKFHDFLCLIPGET